MTAAGWSRAVIQRLLQDNVLLVLTLVYIQLPLLVFLVAWLNPYATVVACSLQLFANWQLVGRYRLTDWSISRAIAPRPLLFIACMVLVLGWLLLSGVGAVGFQNSDYQKHTAMLYDLVRMEWPMTVVAAGEPGLTLHIVYYVGWYLPAALIGKLLGFNAALIASFCWTLLGLWLVMSWLFNFIGRVGPAALLVFVLFSGLDFFGHILVRQQFPGATEHLEWWAGLWQLSSTTSLLFWVPQHALAGWLMTFVYLQLLRLQRNEFLLFLLVPSLLWSPFVALGLMPLALLGTVAGDWRKSVNVANVVASLALGAILCSFLLSKLPDPYAVFLPLSSQREAMFPVLWLFLLLEVGLFAILLGTELLDWGQPFNRALIVSLAFVTGLLLFRYGLYNDLAMRASIPGILLLCLAVIQQLYRLRPATQALNRLLLLVLLAGALNPLQEVMRGVAAFDQPRYLPQPVLGLQPEIARQYLATDDSLFFRYLAGNSQPAVMELNQQLRSLAGIGDGISP